MKPGQPEFQASNSAHDTCQRPIGREYWLLNQLKSEDKTRDGLTDPIGEGALPKRLAMVMRLNRGDLIVILIRRLRLFVVVVPKTSNSDRGVEVLSDLCNHPISRGNSPSVDPEDRTAVIAPLG